MESIECWINRKWWKISKVRDFQRILWNIFEFLRNFSFFFHRYEMKQRKWAMTAAVSFCVITEKEIMKNVGFWSKFQTWCQRMMRLANFPKISKVQSVGNVWNFFTLISKLLVYDPVMSCLEFRTKIPNNFHDKGWISYKLYRKNFQTFFGNPA